MNNIIIVLVLSSTLFFINTTSGYSPIYNQCGRNLITLLSSICKGQYNPPRDKKVPFKTEKIQSEKSYHDENSFDKHNNIDDYFFKQQLVDEFNRKQAVARDQEMQAFLPFPFQNRINAYEMIPHRFRRQSSYGVADECCAKPCTLLELTGYCAK